VVGDRGSSPAVRRSLDASHLVTLAVACTLLLLTGCASGPRSQVAWGANSSMAALGGDGGEASLGIEGLPVSVLVERAKARLEKEDLAMAEYYFVAAFNKEPRSEAVLTGLGEVFHRRGRLEQADAAFHGALETNPESVPAMLGLGKVCRDRGDYEEAVQRLTRAAELAPKSGAPTELALTYEASGQRALAEPLFRVAAENSESSAAYNNLGFNRLLQKRFADAVPPLERAVNLDPQNSRAKNNLAVAYAMTGRPDEAYRLFESTVGKASAYNNLGYLHMTQGNWEQAEAAFRRAMEVSPTFYVRASENLERLEQLVRTKAGEDPDALKQERAELTE